jgi:ribonuclease E
MAEPFAAEPAAAAPSPAPAQPEAPQEPPRRRSTVREAAPVFSSDPHSAPPAAPPAAEPAPQPVITETDANAGADRPRRSGWWSRRSAGG